MGGVGIAGALCAAAPAHASDDDDPYGDASEINMSALGPSDVGFSNLFSSLQRMDGNAKSTAYIPSGRPVQKLSLTSNFGVRSDPFNGGARMHKGVDIPGPVGTPIYATADGIVNRSGWASGYGNLVQISHGHGMETRYGHMSKVLVAANSYVRRGQVIGLMGSTGRSTGSHLHYEVRVDGQAINPIPFVAGPDYLIAMNTRPPVAMGGPTKAEERAAD
ncbi:murein DD-endopeptidase MepM/ murein hydrolase activator NlpD [Sphingobium wenxiniae]|uniref:Peptidase M23-like protein n=2 Tax=Sphingobium TaxID=165695 RepID=A0A562KNS7_SPHWJ|nr:MULTISPECIES: M23 family metallopeptidase [Sphingobium]MBB6191850.1 murein DD-endopeptidase MepM/ murein hydrolase activator NlpD [Sphingobium wenxiniae]TWH96883.1 peptidase M23-like protein [Sphingobium wenxiniae]WRD78315.1 M23 family metallopeptidase [Sphingobium baderi]